jgi:hypothetical protein
MRHLTFAPPPESHLLLSMRDRWLLPSPSLARWVAATALLGLMLDVRRVTEDGHLQVDTGTSALRLVPAAPRGTASLAERPVREALSDLGASIGAVLVVGEEPSSLVRLLGLHAPELDAVTLFRDAVLLRQADGSLGVAVWTLSAERPQLALRLSPAPGGRRLLREVRGGLATVLAAAAAWPLEQVSATRGGARWRLA